jgi:ribosome-binding factor A
MSCRKSTQSPFVTFASMESTRQLKVARMIQKDLGELFQRDGSSWFTGALVSVTKVRISADLSSARVYLSVFGTNEKEKVMNDIKTYSPEIRKKLGLKAGRQLRVVPTLTFFLDDSVDYAAHIDELLKK